MNTSAVETASAYLAVQLTHCGPGGTGAASPGGPFVTISRQSGTGGSALAQALAARLARIDRRQPWSIHSGNLIEEMLRTNDLPAYVARFLPENRLPKIDAFVGELVGLHPDLWDLVAKTNQLIRRLAGNGHALLLGRGGNFATAGLPCGVHVRLVAPAAYRAARTARWLSISREAAIARNEARDAARRDYVRATFDADLDDPRAYTLVLNAASLSLDISVNLILCALEPFIGAPEKSERAASSTRQLSTR